MFRLLGIFKSQLIRSSNNPLPSACFATRHGTFSPREFQFETSDGENGTLIHRFSRHVSLTKRDFTDVTKYSFKVSNFYPLPDVTTYDQQIRDLSTTDLAKLITFTTDFRSKTDTRSYTEVVNFLDEECLGRVGNATVYELLEVLHCFMYLLPNKIAQLRTYRSAMPKLIELFNEAPNERDFLAIVFFLGLWKRHQTGTVLMQEFLQHHVDRFLTPDLDRTDFAILASSTYKTSVRMAEESQVFRSRLIGEIEQFDDQDDPALLVTLIKCARMNRLPSEGVLSKVRSFIEANVQRKELDFRGISHLFAYVADNRVKDDTLTRLIIDSCWKRFEEDIHRNGFESNSQACRPKDIATFLWSCGTLGVPLEDTSINGNLLEKAIRLKVEAGDYRNASDALVDSVLSLWLCGRRSIGLLRMLLKDRMMVQNLRKDRTKIESRKDLLLSCAEIDHPEAADMFRSIRKPGDDAFVLDRRAPEFLARPALRQFVEHLEQMRKAGDVNIASISINLPVKHLNIAGVLVQLADGAVKNLDVLDEKHCLSDQKTPVGLMQLKLRILKDKAIDSTTINVCNLDTPQKWLPEVRQALTNDKVK